MAPKAAEKSAASAAQSHEGFSSPTHLAFSSFSHITDMPTLTMSVGLREDEKKTEEWVAKIIPMAKIIPGEPIERKIRSAVDLADSDVLEAAMEVPEYVELQERLRNLVASNAKARDECEAMEASIRMLTNKIAIGEAKTQTLEEANDAKIEALHETNSRKAVIEIDVKECTRVNLQLQTQVNGLNREVDKLAAQVEERLREARRAACRDPQVVFGPPLSAAEERAIYAAGLGGENEGARPPADEPQLDDESFFEASARRPHTTGGLGGTTGRAPARGRRRARGRRAARAPAAPAVAAARTASATASAADGEDDAGSRRKSATRRSRRSAGRRARSRSRGGGRRAASSPASSSPTSSSCGGTRRRRACSRGRSRRSRKRCARSSSSASSRAP